MSQHTPKELQDRLAQFRKTVGPQSDVYLDICHEREQPIGLSVYANGVGSGLAFRISADDWDHAFAQAAEKWAECSERVVGEKIEKMALEIIRVTGRKGECGGADLRTAKFTQADIDLYGSLACAKADAMANNGPFSIASEARANAA